MKLNSKIAVFVCGPVRYASLVNQRLEHILADVDYDCFFHLWKQDLGNKKRENEETDINCLGRHAKAKVVAYQSPYTIQDFSDYVGTKTNSNSSINATMGMFYSINALCHFLEQLPDSNHYEYILRIRTDCAILNDKFIDKLSFSKKTLTISKNPFIPPGWFSDHICFGHKDNFFKLWRFNNMQEIYDAYLAGNKNPERTLRWRYRQNLKDIQLKADLIRFKDYHIIYQPSRSGDPEALNCAIDDMGLERFFISGSRHIDFSRIDDFIAQYENQWSPKHDQATNDSNTAKEPLPPKKITNLSDGIDQNVSITPNSYPPDEIITGAEALSKTTRLPKRKSDAHHPETHYDTSYFEWQKSIGAFGGIANLFKFKEFIHPESTLVDFGCGGGYLLTNLTAKCKMGIEVNANARAEALRNGIFAVEKTELIPDQYADVIISNHALEHVGNPLGVLVEIRRKLKSNGLAIFVVPHQGPQERYNQDDVNNHLYTWNPQTLGNLFRTAGYGVLTVDLIQHQWPPNYRKVFETEGADTFDKICRAYAQKNDNYQIRIIASRELHLSSDMAA